MATEEQTCPCGMTGANCDQIQEPLQSIELALNETCFEEGFEKCRISPMEALCKCKCGWSGDFCDDRNETLAVNYSKLLLLFFMHICLVIGGIILPFVLLVIFYSMKTTWGHGRNDADEKNASNLRLGISKEEFQLYSFENFSTSNLSWVPPKVLLIYRIMAIFIIVPVLVFTVITEENQYETFSIWNFTLLGTYFFLAAICSAVYMYRHSKASKGILEVRIISGDWEDEIATNSTKRGSFMEKELGFLLHVLFVIELPSALSIASAIWIAFLPQALENGDQGQILNMSSYFLHGANVVLILVELYFNKLYLELRHGGYFYSWAVIYMLFHLGLMIRKEELGEDHCPFYYPLDLSNKMYPQFLTLLSITAVGIFLICCMISHFKYKLMNKEELK